MTKGKFIFLMRDTEDQIRAGRQEDVDAYIKDAENYNEDLRIEVIGKIAEPVDLDFNAARIIWYEQKEERTKREIDLAVMAIVNFIS